MCPTSSELPLPHSPEPQTLENHPPTNPFDLTPPSWSAPAGDLRVVRGRRVRAGDASLAEAQRGRAAAAGRGLSRLAVRDVGRLAPGIGGGA